jgi:hypothetical protein
VDGGEEITRDGPGDLYILDIILVHTTDDPEPAFRVASDAATQIEAAFKRKLYRQGKGWEFIELRVCTAVSDEAITVKQSGQYKEWRLEHLSLRERPAQAMIEH